MADINLVLNFTMEGQDGNFWCWAATGKSVSHFYCPQSIWTQCGIASAELGMSCCNDRESCDEPWYLDKTLIRTTNYVRKQRGVILWEEIKQEIMANRVVCARIRWTGGGGHFVAIFGVEQTGEIKKVCADDPIYGRSIMDYELFCDDYLGLGSWNFTYFTKTGDCAEN